MTTKAQLRERLHALRKSLVRPYEKAKAQGDKAEMRRLEALTAELDGVWERIEGSAFGQLVADITALRLKIEGHASSGTGLISGISLDDLKDKIKEILSVSSEEEPAEGSGTEPGPVFPEPTDGEAPPPVDISPDVVTDDPGIADTGALILSEAHLIGLWKRSQLPIDGRGIIVFGLRGCRPVDFAGTDFASAHEIALREVNYKTMNCTIGQWRPNGGLALFPGSTVPFHTIVARKVGNRGIGVNQMGCGRYKNYAHGWHKRSEGQSGHWALRQECAITIQRTGDDTDYDLDDRWEVGRIAGDNIHCAFHMGADGAIPDSRFSSAGCQTIAGTVKKGVRGSERGPWRKFIAPFRRDSGMQDSAEYVLFLAEEAQQMIRTRCAGKTVILRMGSGGPLVRQLQEALSARLSRPIKVDGDFGTGTFQAVIDFQTGVFGANADDGIVGPDTAEELGLTLPAFDFSNAISGGPGFEAGSVVPSAPGGTGAADGGGGDGKLAWGAVTERKHGPDFKAKVISISKRLRCDPDHLMAVMAFETGGKFTPDVKNAAGSGATGLIQFMPKTAIFLGTTTKKLAKMTALDQLDFVELYFRKTIGSRPMPNLSDVYMAVLWPAAVGKSENFVLFEQGTTAYRQNAGLDKNRDGVIRKAEAAAKVFDKLVLGQKEGRLG
ncbi:peptidoglycan-binding protein [Hoeflea sp. TYP-13]|uniref:peptidoglycan-binding protein n=1 Tax=Hoeflea sp. TYP-13 TaxID=3230023 RepID=UPI0034C6C90C